MTVVILQALHMGVRQGQLLGPFSSSATDAHSQPSQAQPTAGMDEAAPPSGLQKQRWPQEQESPPSAGWTSGQPRSEPELQRFRKVLRHR